MADLETINKKLPSWAVAEKENRHGMPIIKVDIHEAYPALLEEYREHYQEHPPTEFLGRGDEGMEAWDVVLEDLEQAPEDVSAYWLEVLYQSAKMDIVLAAGFNTENHFKDPGKTFRQADREPGRGKEKLEEAVAMASGGLNGGKEAREHYKRLRGFLPV